jgi:hypothetical protein
MTKNVPKYQSPALANAINLARLNLGENANPYQIAKTLPLNQRADRKTVARYLDLQDAHLVGKKKTMDRRAAVALRRAIRALKKEGAFENVTAETLVYEEGWSKLNFYAFRKAFWASLPEGIRKPSKKTINDHLKKHQFIPLGESGVPAPHRQARRRPQHTASPAA